MNEPMKVEVQGYQVLEKKVKAAGSSGRIYVPKEWVGKRVRVILLEPTTDEG